MEQEEAYLQFNMQIYISKEEWEIVNYVHDIGNPPFAEALKHMDKEGNINGVIRDPWRFLAYYFHSNFCCWPEEFMDKQLDRNDEVAHRERFQALRKGLFVLD